MTLQGRLHNWGARWLAAVRKAIQYNNSKRLTLAASARCIVQLNGVRKGLAAAAQQQIQQSKI